MSVRPLDPANPQDYDIMSALRGPDDSGPVAQRMKWLTTGVVRHFAGCSHSIGVVSTPEEVAYYWSTLGDLERENMQIWWWESAHFRVHVREAFYALSTEARDYLTWLDGIMRMNHD